MPPPLPVELLPHDPKWLDQARERGAELRRVLGPLLIAVHHVGSTSIPGIRAKPILDLLPEVASLDGLEGARARVESLGYAWWGEYGLKGRRYCSLTDSATGKRLVQLHFYEAGSPQITRHLAFRDYVKRRPDLAADYEALKLRCREAHPNDSHAYTDCKSAWIRRIETEALAAGEGQT